MADAKSKTPYTGPSQVVTTDTHRKIYVEVFQKARRMTVFSGVFTAGHNVRRDNLSDVKYPALWAVVNLIDRRQVADGKFYVRLTLGELEAAEPELAAWVRQEVTKQFFGRNQHNV